MLRLLGTVLAVYVWNVNSSIATVTNEGKLLANLYTEL